MVIKKYKNVVAVCCLVFFGYVAIGIYAPNYSIKRHNLGANTLGEYYVQQGGKLNGLSSFISLANTVVFDVITNGALFEAKSMQKELLEDIDTIKAQNPKNS